MAKAILMSGGVGGVTSDDVTASKAQVLQGYKTVTADSDDEVVEGTMSNRGNGMVAVDFTNAHWESKFVARMEEGYYSQAGQWKPYVAIPYAVLAQAAGVDASKMLQTLTIAGKQGQIKTIKTSDDNYKVNKQNSSYGIDGVRGTFYIDMPHGNAYYCRDDGHPHTCIDIDKLGDTTADKVLQGSTFTSKNGVAVRGTMSNRGNGMVAVDFTNAHWESKFVARMEEGYYSQAGQWKPYVAIPYAVLAQAAGVDASKMLQDYSIAGVQGTIPRWVCTTGDVITALGGEGFAWDDIYAGRGRGIVMKIPNKRFIQDANYAFLASPNLYPQNIRAGVNINGVVGTMPDYSTGRTVFNGATFDGTLLLGVANKDFYVGGDYYALDLAVNYRYSGIYNGGINLSLSTAMPSIRGRYIGCIISQSVNLTPFNRIDVYWRVIGDIKNDAYINFAAGISKSSTLVRGGMVIGSNPKDGFTEQAVQDVASGPQITKSGKLELYVGGINEQGFLYFYASTNISSGRDAFTGSIQITKIDFLN